MNQQIRFCTSADGTKIAYAMSGSGPPLLLTTSWVNHLEYGAQMLPWNSWHEALSREYTLVRYDTRGCGMSDRGVRGLGIESFVADVTAVAEAARLERFSMLRRLPLRRARSGDPRGGASYQARRALRMVAVGGAGQIRFLRDDFRGGIGSGKHECGVAACASTFSVQ